MTLRQCPENYCLAIYRDYPKGWVAGVDKAAPVTASDVQRVLDKHRGIKDYDKLAKAVEAKLFKSIKVTEVKKSYASKE